MTRLAPASLAFAKTHIRNFYDSDFLPKPFEYSALWAQWDEVSAVLSSTDIDQLPIVQPREFAVPKPKGAFRVVHQLDPLNALAYAALVHQLAPYIENARAPREARVACSYRIEIDPGKGSFFSKGNGYQEFRTRCQELALSKKFVLATDIADFYNQIYIHRTENAISAAAPHLKAVAKSLEDFVIALNSGASQGIPVGPAPSIVLAEATLMDVDDFILSRTRDYTRYVDDIRIFSDRKDHLEQLLQDLTLYLYRTHRLSLSGLKTEILSAFDYQRKHLNSPEELERQEIFELIWSIAGPYAAQEEAERPPGSSIKIPFERKAEIMSTLMVKLCARPTLDLGLARHILRECRRDRIRSIIPLLFKRFAFFAPVMPDVILYLDRVTGKGFVAKYRSELVGLYTGSGAMHLEFVRYWFEHYIAKHWQVFQGIAGFERVFVDAALDNLAERAVIAKDIAWVRAQRHKLDELGPRDRRHIIRSSVVLSGEERRNLYSSLERNSRGLLESAVIKWVKSR